ncbi:UNVERIFIED_CONTAM: hypothetical protein RMT77_011449 [Armadillidium vulgare]
MDREQEYYEETVSRFFGQRLNITYDLGQDILHSQVPQLQSLILIKVISDFWQDPEVRKEVSIFVIAYPDTLVEYCKDIFWVSVEEKVKSKLTHLRLTQACKDLSYRICNAIGRHIYEYITDNHFEKIPKILYAENFAITYQGTINKMKTILLILQKLTDPCMKYEFVCYYFIENQVRYHFHSLPPHLKFYYLYELERSLPNFTLAFWGWRLSADKTLFYEITRLYRFGIISYVPTSIRECLIALFEWQVLCNNVVAVQYLWKTMLDEEEKENTLLPRSIEIINSDKHRNMMCYFIGHMNTEQQIKLLKDNAFRILIRFLDWRWERVFLEAAKFAFKFLTHWDFAEILHALVYYVCYQHKYFSEDPSSRRVLTDFLNHSPAQSREYITKAFPNKYYDMMVNLLKINDQEIIDLLTTFSQPRDLMYSPKSIDLCVEFIEEAEYESIDLYIKSNLKFQDQILDFKRHFIEQKGQELCVKLISLERWRDVDNFIKWCPFNEKEEEEFKGNLPFAFKGEIINVFISNLGFDFKGKTKTIDRVLNWCFEHNTSLIRDCKKKVLFNDSNFYIESSFKYRCVFYSEAKKLIMRRKWDIVTKCFDWCYAHQEDIKSFCNKFLSDKAFIMKIVKCDLRLELLAYFLECCSYDYMVPYIVKVTIIENHAFFVNLIAKLKLEEAEHILDWCMESVLKKNLLKQALFALCMRPLLKYVSKEESLKKLLQWFNPTSKSIANLRRCLSEWYEPGNEELNPKIDRLLEHLKKY